MRDTLIFTFRNSADEYRFSEAIRSPLPGATLTVGTEMPGLPANRVIVRPDCP